MRSAGIAWVALLALTLSSGGPSRAAAVESGLVGAWAQDGNCDEVFSRSGKAVSFKKPVNVFAPAFIITGNRLRTPTASCTIKGVKPAGDRRVLSLQCATAIAVDDVKAIVGTSADGGLVRYLNDQDSTGSTYKRCTM
jgi:hypothetical protein